MGALMDQANRWRVFSGALLLAYTTSASACSQVEYYIHPNLYTELIRRPKDHLAVQALPVENPPTEYVKVEALQDTGRTEKGFRVMSATDYAPARAIGWTLVALGGAVSVGGLIAIVADRAPSNCQGLYCITAGGLVGAGLLLSAPLALILPGGIVAGVGSRKRHKVPQDQPGWDYLSLEPGMNGGWRLVGPGARPRPLQAATPHLPDKVWLSHRGSTVDGSYKICVERAGNVASVTVIGGIADADEAIVAVLRGWTFPPQPAPTCFVERLRFEVP